MVSWQEQANVALKGIEKRFQVPMTELTTFKIGGPLDLLVEPETEEDIQKILNFCHMEKLPWMIIGLGSNLLVRDKGIRGIGIKLSGKFNSFEIGGETVTAGAGMALGDLAKETAYQGLSGLEFACGIPGTVGGGAYMNAGAYDGEMAGVLKRVQAIDEIKGPIWYERAELNMGYRKSRFQSSGQIITMVQLKLKKGDKESAESKIAQLSCSRESKQPLDMPSAGSVFRRPEGHYVGPLIEQSGLKGFSIGGAQISTKHAGFIVNTGGATAGDVIGLIKHIQTKVKEKFNVELTPEIRIVGEE